MIPDCYINGEEKLEISSGSQKRSLFKAFKKVVAGVFLTAAIGGIGWGTFHLIISAPIPQLLEDLQELFEIRSFLEQEYPEILPIYSSVLNVGRAMILLFILIRIPIMLEAFYQDDNAENHLMIILFFVIILFATSPAILGI